jgi:hypothetical protein
MSPERKGLDLKRVVLLGRTLEEYLRFFGLSLAALRGKKVLDVAGGVSSFTAEARAQGIEARAFDRIYSFRPDEIQEKGRRDLEEVTAAIGDKAVYRWDFYKNPQGMKEFRKRALETFLADFRNNHGRYVAGELPATPFADGEFDLTLVSYLLLVYEEQLSYEFHRDSFRELMRITAGEIRVYPIVTFEAQPSLYLERLKAEEEFRAWKFEVVKTDFEFLRGSNCYLKISRS